MRGICILNSLYDYNGINSYQV